MHDFLKTFTYCVRFFHWQNANHTNDVNHFSKALHESASIGGNYCCAVVMICSVTTSKPNWSTRFGSTT